MNFEAADGARVVAFVSYAFLKLLDHYMSAISIKRLFVVQRQHLRLYYSVIPLLHSTKFGTPRGFFLHEMNSALSTKNIKILHLVIVTRTKMTS
jgi:hypothetical protein